MTAYRGRFAPSPTGALHLGTARTAWLAWKAAREAGGAYLLRFEDLDQPRVIPGADQAMLEDLRWLGLDWDGEPCWQSRRLGLYEEAFEMLRARGLVYACTCSRKEVAASASAPHGEEGPLYPGTCRSGAKNPERAPAWRFRMDAPEPFTDLALGPQAGWQDDFVVRRADGVFAYQFACAVDDAAMGITHVLRGADLLASTSRQIALLKALGAALPTYEHVPLWLGPDGERLAKRHGALGIGALRAQGRTAAQVVEQMEASLQGGGAGGS